MWSDAAAPLRPVQWMPLDAGERATPSPAAASARAEAEAESLLRAARAEAARIAAAAAAERLNVLQQARQEGLAQGRAEGRAEAEAQQADLLREARRARHHARAAHRALLRGLEAEIAGLALDIARQVLGRELEQSPDEVVGLTHRLLRRVHGPARALVNPGFAPVLEAETAAAGSALTVQGDPSVGPDGVILETEDGLLDATLPSRLGRVEAAVRGDAGHAL